jgi:hypothetical protein
MKINETFIDELNEKEQSELVDYLLIKLKESYSRGEITLQRLIENFDYDDYQYDSVPCDQCGDTVSTTIWNI